MKFYLKILAIIVFTLAYTNIVNAKCMAEVDVKNFWEEKGGFKQSAKLKVQIESARPGAYVKVHVDVRFHYEREDGWSNTKSASDSVRIDTSDHSSETFVIDTRATNCSKEKSCEIKDVEIRDISCYD